MPPDLDLAFSTFLADIPECASCPCYEGHTEFCMDSINEYECVCKQGFNGTHCEQGNTSFYQWATCPNIYAPTRTVAISPYPFYPITYINTRDKQGLI